MHRRLLLVLAIAMAGVSCGKKPQQADSATDDAKLRPEVAAAKQGASPTPAGETGAGSPTPSPSL